MSGALPKICYQDPERVFEKLDAKKAFQQDRCLACESWKPALQGDPCRQRLTPGKHWCKGFIEK